MNKTYIVLFLLVILAVAGGAGGYWYFSRTPDNPGIITLSGNIEVDDVALSFKIPGEVVARPVSEGEHITKGQVIARLDDVEWKQEVELRNAEIEVYEAELDELLSGARKEEIQRAEAALEQARATAQQRERDLERARRLYEKDLLAAQDFENARTNYETARQQVREKREMLQELVEGPREERIRRARARLKQAKKRLDIAQTKLGYTTLRSPIDGIVLAEHVEPGEHVVSGVPVVTVGNLRDVWLRAYLEESDLGRVHHGMPATITTDSYPNKTYPARVSFIADEAEFTPKNIETRKVRTRLVYRIKLNVENPELELKPGMPADAMIQVEEPPDERS